MPILISRDIDHSAGRTRGAKVPVTDSMVLIETHVHIDWLPWSLLVAAMLHMTEEFFWPGGFPAWYRRYRGPNVTSITPRFLVIINLILLAVCVNVALSVGDPVGDAYWMAISAVVASNGLWHLWAAVKSRAYSPGMITGLLLYIPLAIYGCVHFVGSGLVSVRGGAIALLLGASFPFWDALYHARSKKPARSSLPLQ